MVAASFLATELGFSTWWLLGSRALQTHASCEKSVSIRLMKLIPRD